MALPELLMCSTHRMQQQVLTTYSSEQPHMLMVKKSQEPMFANHLVILENLEVAVEKALAAN